MVTHGTSKKVRQENRPRNERTQGSRHKIMAKMSSKMMKAYAAYEKKEPAATKKKEAKAGMKMLKKKGKK